MDIGTLLVFVAVVIAPLIWVMRSHSNMNREIGELAKDVKYNSKEIERIRDTLDRYVGRWEVPEEE